ncbi:Acyl carrier protein [uncultured Eubacteriales bacterium]|uniref:Acyl carrier protein n=1 Tax=uncultured Eubacteriales bacterium TaxID=172733 RepID=A0A212KAD0_9FIRM|nr:Acyl carrier protein [uncultured Eubacteriales bacterium]
MIFEKVAAIIADNKDLDVASIKPESTFEELGFDSLDTVELVMAFEEEFGIAIELEDGGVKTVADLVKLIESLQNA